MDLGTVVIAYWSEDGLPPWGTTPLRVVLIEDIRHAFLAAKIRECEEHLVKFREQFYSAVILEILEEASLTEELKRVFGSNTLDMARLEKRGARQVENLRQEKVAVALQAERYLSLQPCSSISPGDEAKVEAPAKASHLEQLMARKRTVTSAAVSSSTSDETEDGDRIFKKRCPDSLLPETSASPSFDTSLNTLLFLDAIREVQTPFDMHNGLSGTFSLSNATGPCVLSLKVESTEPDPNPSSFWSPTKSLPEFPVIKLEEDLVEINFDEIINGGTACDGPGQSHAIQTDVFTATAEPIQPSDGVLLENRPTTPAERSSGRDLPVNGRLEVSLENILDVNDFQSEDSSPFPRLLRKRPDTKPKASPAKPKKANSPKGKAKPASKRCAVDGCPDPTDNCCLFVVCSFCPNWVHGRCCGIYTERHYDPYTSFSCPSCTAKDTGVTETLERTSSHRNDCYEKDPFDKPTQIGSDIFVAELIAKLDSEHFSRASDVDVVRCMKGADLTMKYMQKSAFRLPILVSSPDGLNMTLPDASYGFESYAVDIGMEQGTDFAMFPVLHLPSNTWDAKNSITIRDWLHFVDSRPHEDLLSVYNHEPGGDSDDLVNKRFEPPRIVREMSWAQNFSVNGTKPPKVFKYFSLLLANSYYDFDIHSNGASNWFHVFKGKQTFLLVEPTENNLKRFCERARSRRSSEICLATMPGVTCYRVDVDTAATLFVPSGWIVASFSPVDSLVFSGYFLHDLAVEMQLKITLLNDKLGTPEKERIQHFSCVCWSALHTLVTRAQERRKSKKAISERQRTALKAFADGLKGKTLKGSPTKKNAPGRRKFWIWNRTDNKSELVDNQELLRSVQSLLA